MKSHLFLDNNIFDRQTMMIVMMMFDVTENQLRWSSMYAKCRRLKYLNLYRTDNNDIK